MSFPGLWITLENFIWTLSIWSQCLIRLLWISSGSKITDISLLEMPAWGWSFTVAPETPTLISPSEPLPQPSSKPLAEIPLDQISPQVLLRSGSPIPSQLLVT